MVDDSSVVFLVLYTPRRQALNRFHGVSYRLEFSIQRGLQSPCRRAILFASDFYCFNHIFSFEEGVSLFFFFFLLAVFKIFALSLVLSSLTMMYVGEILLKFYKTS